MKKHAYQVHISLRDSEPEIWRRLLVPADMLLPDFHRVIQSSMGWLNMHLHHFADGNTFYLLRSPDDDFWDELDNVEYNDVKLSDLLKNEKDSIIYEYDFGDGWIHDIVLERILPVDTEFQYPICVDGQMNCPPEDCGGIWGYSELLEILKNPNHEEYEDTIDWLGDEFDPEYFNKDEVNQLLREKDFGCTDLDS
ncbi:MAG: plasmid pRiA4b ORF-3 family protein [Spirochaetota bacterium]